MSRKSFKNKSGKIGWESFNFTKKKASSKLFFSTVIKKYKKDTISYYASGLVYSTLIALIPCITLTFSLLGNWGVLSPVIDMTSSFLHEVFGSEMGTKIETLINTYTSNAGSLGFFGLISFSITYLLLVNKIFMIINLIFHTEVKAKTTKRFISYLAFLFIGTFLLAIYFSIVSVSSGWFSFFTGAQPKIMSDFSKYLFPRLVLFGVLFLLYFLVPNTKVKGKSALLGSLFSTCGIIILSFIFQKAAAFLVNYSVIYGSISVIFIFFIWLFLFWQIFLLGLEMSYINQFKPYYYIHEIGGGYNQLSELINITLLVSKNFKMGKGSTELSDIERGLAIDNVRLMKLLKQLENGNILFKNDRSSISYFPAKPLEDIKIKEIIGLGFSSKNDQISNKKNLGLKYSLKFLNIGLRNMKDSSIEDLIMEFENLKTDKG
ncbi:MAG: YihY/virulence factor BrkB family protein [Sphaerochaetaceae bacterium]|nr:YihY/virulence factor BrkB family protein [Sphaerochaetaceae bacterium]